MTCIVGVLDKGRTYIGGDSAGVGGMSITVRGDTKVFRVGGYVMGFTSSFRMGQLLHHAFRPPKPPTKNVDRFLVTTFVDALRECLEAGGHLSSENQREEGGTFLVGFPGVLAAVYDDFQIARFVDGYAATGCGEDLALGSLHSTAGLEPRSRVRAALEAAEHHSAGVIRPFKVLATKDVAA